MLPNLQAKLASFNLKHHQWLWYPALVGALLLFGTGYLATSAGKLVANFSTKQEQTETNEATIRALENKLANLRRLDPTELDTRLQELHTSYPVNMDLLTYSQALQAISTKLNFPVLAFRSTGSKDKLNLSVALEVNTVGNVLQVLTELYNQKPVMRVVGLTFKSGRLDLLIEPGGLL